MPLTQKQITVIGECLRAAAYGPFFPDGEFNSIFGLTRAQVAAVADQWPVVLKNADIVDTAIHNAFNNLIGYPIKNDKMAVWDEFVSTDRNDLVELFRDWQTNK